MYTDLSFYEYVHKDTRFRTHYKTYFSFLNKKWNKNNNIKSWWYIQSSSREQWHFVLVKYICLGLHRLLGCFLYIYHLKKWAPSSDMHVDTSKLSAKQTKYMYTIIHDVINVFIITTSFWEFSKLVNVDVLMTKSHNIRTSQMCKIPW